MIGKYGNSPCFDSTYHFGYVIGWLCNIRHYNRIFGAYAYEIYPNICNDADIIATTNKADTRPSNGSVLSKLVRNGQGHTPVLITGITNNQQLAAETLWMGWGQLKVDFILKNDLVRKAFMTDVDRDAPNFATNRPLYKGCTSFVESLICDFGFNVIKFPDQTKAMILPPFLNGKHCAANHIMEPAVYSDHDLIEDVLANGYDKADIETVLDGIIARAGDPWDNEFCDPDFRKGFIDGFNA